MATKFVVGQKVRQIMPAPIEGVIKEFTFDKTTAVVSVVIGVTGADGVEHERVFLESNLEGVA